MPDVAITSGRRHGEIVGILFEQAHRETDRFKVLQLQALSMRNTSALLSTASSNLRLTTTTTLRILTSMALL